MQKITAQATSSHRFLLLQTRHTIRPVYKDRFSSQAILDEVALAACMAYVDLNPIRSKMANTVETSDHTSIKRRIQNALNSEQPDYKNNQPKSLFPFVGNPRDNMHEGLPFNLTDYIELVEMTCMDALISRLHGCKGAWTGRQLRAGKRGKIDASLSPILTRLNFEAENWLYLSRHFESKLKGLVGSVIKLKQACKKLGYMRTVCKQSCEQFFS